MVPYQLVVTHELYHSQDKLSRIISHSPDIESSDGGESPGFCKSYLPYVGIATQVVCAHYFGSGFSCLVKCRDVVDATTAIAEV